MKIPKIFSVLEKIFQLDRSHGSVQFGLKVQWILRKIILTWNVWWLLIVDDILEIQSSYYSTLGMVNRGWWCLRDPKIRTSREKLLKDNFHTRKKRTVNIPDDRFLQLTQQILEMLKSTVIMFQQARFQSSRQPIVHGHGLWMDVWEKWEIREKARRDYCIGPGS